MTTTRDRRSDVEQDRAESDWASLSLFGSSRGVPWWAAVLLAFGVSLLTAFVNRAPNGELGWIFKSGYFLSCVVAVCWVQRKSLFGPMVQPPLVAVIVVPAVALISSTAPPSGGTTARLLTVAQPLVTSFPAMAVTTAATVILGVVRIFLQKRPAAAAEARPARPRPVREEDEPVRRPAGGRTPAPRPQPGGRPAPRDGAPAPRGGGVPGGAAGGGAAGGRGAGGRGAAGGPGGGRAGGARDAGGAAGGRGGAAGGGRPVPPRGGQPGRQQPPPPQRGGPPPRTGGQPPAPRRRPPRDDDY
ncbi:hypothetical protein M8C13_14790 [Crossiella sp. SN42]|uniref:DUF6542 domain-containing protein n=1 Tax=Crossiella sp. SN42 TaxID=2944808 RepID=UPI00207D4AC4|nr:DUF6542 domain-containing protein [Crossiella sp. SN42]MCO1577023.1 hypothetical protein [Crossiella sp. SN42]